MTDKELWQMALSQIELQTSRATFMAWFKDTYINSNKNGIVIIATPSVFTRNWLQSKYDKKILKILRDTINTIKEVKFVVRTKQSAHIPDIIQNKKEMDGQLIFENIHINSETNLNPKYTFTSFIVGPSNELAHAAAISVSENPGHIHNPLFIYGGVGLGKTHLLQSMGNALHKKNKNVIYLTSEQFTNEFITSIQKGSKEAFNKRYRTKDVLIIDDIQFIAGKEQTQEEFFHTFNSLYEKNKQIILSSDRSPKAISTLEERLRSRFEGGMLVDVSNPDYETRLAILHEKTKEKQITIEDSILEKIAESIKNNIRELEGALNLVLTSSKSLYNDQITKEQVQKVLASLLYTPQKQISHKHIIKTVANFYEIQEGDIMKKNRKQEIVLPRQIVMFLMRNELKKSYPYIGESLGGRDHTTVMHACDKIGKKLQEDMSFEETLNNIKQAIYT